MPRGRRLQGRTCGRQRSKGLAGPSKIGKCPLTTIFRVCDANRRKKIMTIAKRTQLPPITSQSNHFR